MTLPFKRRGKSSPWTSTPPEPEIPHEDIDCCAAVDSEDRPKLFRGLLFATPISLLLWWGIYALVRAWS